MKERDVLLDPGDGYGLNLVASIMSLYNGTSEIRNNTPQGTVITISLALPNSLPASSCSALSGQPLGFPRHSRLPRLYPRTNSGWLYALLTTIPNVFYINTALIAAYFLERFFNWQIAYGLCRVIVCAVCFIRRRFEKS